jgi:hypothetical protein
MLIHICQIMCFPFAIEANEEIICRTYSIIKDFNFFNKILSCLMTNNQMQHDIPISLIARLILTDNDLCELLANQINTSDKVTQSNFYFIYQKNQRM